jgi:hypothetical protein
MKMSHLDSIVVRDIGLQDVNIGPPGEFFGHPFVGCLLITNQSNDLIVGVCGDLAKELPL